MRRFLATLLWIVLAGVAIILALVDEVTAGVGPPSLRQAIRLGSLFLVPFLLWRIRRSYGRKVSGMRPVPPYGGTAYPDPAEIRRAAREMARRYGPGTGRPGSDGPIETFVGQLLIDTVARRATETLHLCGENLVGQVDLEIAPGPGRGTEDAPAVRLLPILHRKRGLEDFEISAASGEVRVLDPLETQGLLYLVVKMLYRLLLPREAVPGVHLDDVHNRAVGQLAAIVCRLERMDDATFDRAFDHAMRDVVTVRAGRLREACRFFARNYVTIVEVPDRGEDVVSVTYTSTLPPAIRTATWNDRARTRVGLYPYRFLIPLYWPFFAERYTLTVVGPDGQFVYRHYVAAADGSPLVVDDVETLGDSPPFLQLGPNDASPSAAVTTRNFHQVRPQELTCVVEFEEVPPGALRGAVVAMAVCTLLLAVCAVALPGADETFGEVPVDVAALLLTTSVIAFSWQSSERLQQSSLTTYGGLVLARLISIGGALLYLIQALTWGSKHVWRLHILDGIALPPVDPAWLIPAAFSAAVTICLAMQHSHRMARYHRALERRRTDWRGVDRKRANGSQGRLSGLPRSPSRT